MGYCGIQAVVEDSEEGFRDARVGDGGREVSWVLEGSLMEKQTLLTC